MILKLIFRIVYCGALAISCFNVWINISCSKKWNET